jgi:hypothetical protein
MAALAEQVIDSALKNLEHLPEILPSFITEDNLLSELAEAYLANLLRYKRDAASKIILNEVQKGTSIYDI